MINELIKKFSDFISRLPGLPILIAVGLIAFNFLLQILPAWPVVGWLADTNFFMHIALIIALLGLLLGDAL